MNARSSIYYSMLQNVTSSLIESQIERGVNRQIIDDVDKEVVIDFDERLSKTEKDSFVKFMFSPDSVFTISENEIKALDFAKEFFFERTEDDYDCSNQIDYLVKFYGDKGLMLKELGKRIDKNVFSKFDNDEVYAYLD